MDNNLIEINSKLGKVRIEKDKIITFKKGVLAFKDLKKFVLLNIEKDSPFKLLQSMENPNLGFIVANPLTFKYNYEVIVKRGDIEELKIESAKEALVLVIITIPNNDIDNITANLKGPILINEKNNLAKQIVIDSDKYPVKYPLVSKNTKVAWG